jgi:hypothetical protein
VRFSVTASPELAVDVRRLRIGAAEPEPTNAAHLLGSLRDRYRGAGEYDAAQRTNEFASSHGGLQLWAAS